MSARLEGRVALVTGAASGIGAEVARQLAGEGAAVLLGDLDEDRARVVAQEIVDAGGRACTANLDVTDSASVRRIVAQAIDELGGLDILVNNAGIIRDAFLDRMTEEHFDEVMAVHLKGAFLCIQAAVPQMRVGSYGKIVNVSSIAGKVGNMGQANYAAAKAGLVGLTKTAAKELARDGIRVNAVQPGFVETPMTRTVPEKVRLKKIAEVPLGHFGAPIDIARPIVFLAKPDSDYMTGTVLEITGGRYM